MKDQYAIKNIENIDSPALLIYPDIVARNIELCKTMVNGDCNKLRPHVKTNKMPEVCQMMISAGITKYKCATIAEAEMLGICKAPDVLLAYQPIGIKVKRLILLIKAYPFTEYSCLIDNLHSAQEINAMCQEENITLPVFIDLNVGMGRTGILPESALSLINYIKELGNLKLIGLHGYDGHIHNSDIKVRKVESDKSYALVKGLYEKVQPLFSHPLSIVMGGTPSFGIHAEREGVECSPGTFVFWDWGYKEMLPEMKFEYAAVLISRVISIVDKTHICIDLGHKSVAAENTLSNRVLFLNHPDAKPIEQNEEHLVLEVEDSTYYAIGDIFYAIPKHICPTVALYERVQIVENNKAIKEWRVIARDRKINY